MVIQNWNDIVMSSLHNFFEIVVGFLPSLIGAFIVIIIGLIIASVFGIFIERLLGVLKINLLLKKLRLDSYFERVGLRLNVSRFFGRLVYWFLIIAFVLAASDILGFLALSSFLKDVLLYIPNILIAALIMLAVIVLGNFLRSLVVVSATASKLHASKFLGAFVWWSVVIFGFFASLIQLGIAVSIIYTLIIGLTAMIALAGGIAFGLGGRDYAASLIEKFKQETK